MSLTFGSICIRENVISTDEEETKNDINQAPNNVYTTLAESFVAAPTNHIISSEEEVLEGQPNTYINRNNKYNNNSIAAANSISKADKLNDASNMPETTWQWYENVVGALMTMRIFKQDISSEKLSYRSLCFPSLFFYSPESEFYQSIVAEIK
eukprot:394304_1